MIVVPTQLGFSAFTININLDEVTYNLLFIWNSREEEWYMDILDVDNVALIRSVKLVLNYDLLETYDAIEGLPAGVFIFIQASPDAVMSSENFGTDFLLTYFTAAEVLEETA
jgi:hypothetical protein